MVGNLRPKDKKFRAKNNIGVEVAPSSRSGCRICNKQIFKGRPRLVVSFELALKSNRYFHPSCWAEEDEHIWEFHHEEWEEPDEIESRESDYER